MGTQCSLKEQPMRTGRGPGGTKGGLGGGQTLPEVRDDLADFPRSLVLKWGAAYSLSRPITHVNYREKDDFSSFPDSKRQYH